MKAAHDSLTIGEKAIAFFNSLELQLPPDLKIEVLNPYKKEQVKKYVEIFFTKYFSDNRKRIFLFGINPGRFGSGITGISFTDPVALREYCGIENELGNKRELSSEFIYKVIFEYGGVEKFYKNFFLTAICPLGFLKGAVNYNYYDERELQKAVMPFIEKTFRQQTEIGARKEALICIGSNKNSKVIQELNKQLKYFDKVISLEHPRFIMQYKRKKLDEYVQLYVKVLNELTRSTNPTL